MAVQARPVPQSSETPFPAYLIAILFLVCGAAAFALLGSNIVSITSTAVVDEAGGTTLLRFLNTYGIIVPLILTGAGVYLLLLGVRLFRLDIKAATWARQLLLWLTIAAAVLIVQGVGSGLGDGSVTQALQNVLLYLAAAAVFGIAWWWLGQNMAAYTGQETLEEASARSAWNLLVPTLIILVVVALRPLERTFIASLTDDEFASDRPTNFVGLSNYAQLLGLRFDTLQCERGEDGACLLEDGETVFPRARDVLDEGYTELRFREVTGIRLGDNRLIFSTRDDDFWDSIGNTLTFSFFSVIIELVLGLFIALVINSKFTGRGLLRTAMLVPWAIPTVVSARLWEMMMRDNSSGVINAILLNLNLINGPQAWLANPDLQIPALIAVDVWKTTPFMALILLAGLQVIPSDVYEAADVDGASRVRQFFSITLPLLRPAIAVALVFRTLDAVRVFDVFNVLLGRAKLSMATYNYETLVNEQQLGYASAIGVLIFAIILIFTVIYVRALGVRAE